MIKNLVIIIGKYYKIISILTEIAAIFFAVYWIINIPNPEEDIYFQIYDHRNDQNNITIIYKYDAETKTASEIGRVSGYFHNAEIDSEKKYITGVRSAWAIYNEPPDDDFGIVRFSLEDGTSELLVTAEQISNLGEDDIHWDYIFPFDNGKQICIEYSSWNILYNIESGEIIDSHVAPGHIRAINGDNVWYSTGGGIERRKIASQGSTSILSKGVTRFTVSNSGKRIAFFGDEDTEKQIYLLEVATKTKKRILKAGWNRSFQDIGLQSSGWDKSGKYYYYIEHFNLLFNDSHAMIKIYNLKTKRTRCILFYRNTFGTEYAFIRNAN